MDTRTSGMSAVVFCNYLLSFMIGQSFLSCLCAMQWGGESAVLATVFTGRPAARPP